LELAPGQVALTDRWDVFISYARSDREVAHRLSEALRQRGFRVWWDWDLVGGEDFRGRIRDVIDATERVLVLWSATSVQSHFVIDEASEAKRQGKLVPLSIDGTQPPFGFGGLHTVAVRDFDRDLDAIVLSLKGAPPKARRDGGGPLRPAPFLTRRRLVAGAGAAAAVIAGAAAYQFVTANVGVGTDAEHGGATGEANSGEVARDAFANLRRTALVIGNSEYANVQKLYNPKRDSGLVAKALEARGFAVIHHLDLRADEMREAFQTLETALSVNGGVGLFYYAGNAAHIDGMDILLPIDAAYDPTTSEITGGLNLTEMQKRIQSRTTKKFRDNGSATIYSASKGERASDGPPGGNSPFAKAFLATLDTNQGELGELFTDICVAMEPPDDLKRQATRGVKLLRAARQLPVLSTQTPTMERALTKSFYFNDPSRDADIGVMKILVLDSCRDNPFEVLVAER